MGVFIAAWVALRLCQVSENSFLPFATQEKDLLEMHLHKQSNQGCETQLRFCRGFLIGGYWCLCVSLCGCYWLQNR